MSSPVYETLNSHYLFSDLNSGLNNSLSNNPVEQGPVVARSVKSKFERNILVSKLDQIISEFKTIEKTLKDIQGDDKKSRLVYLWANGPLAKIKNLGQYTIIFEGVCSNSSCRRNIWIFYVASVLFVKLNSKKNPYIFVQKLINNIKLE